MGSTTSLYVSVKQVWYGSRSQICLKKLMSLTGENWADLHAGPEE